MSKVDWRLILKLETCQVRNNQQTEAIVVYTIYNMHPNFIQNGVLSLNCAVSGQNP